MEGNKMEENVKEKTNFLKRIWYSIAKPSKYEEMLNEGIWQAIKYFLLLIITISIIFAFSVAIPISSRTNEIINYPNIQDEALYSYFVGNLFTSFLISTVLIYIFYYTIIATSMWLVTKISKEYWTYKKSIIYTIYASTLSAILYAIYVALEYILNFHMQSVTTIIIFLIYVHIYLVLRIERNQKKKGMKQ